MKQKLLKVLMCLGVAICLTANTVFAYTTGAAGYDYGYEYEEIMPIGTPPRLPNGNWSD